MIASKYLLIKKSVAVVFFLSLTLAACEEPAPPKEAEAHAPAKEREPFAALGRTWLDVSDKISPAVWLASREAGRDVSANDPAAASFRGLLAEADARFTEGPRMIANRAIQVQSMLAERGVKETPREVIEGLVSIGAVGERAGFGETCQHYVNARSNVATRAEALEALRRQPLPAATGSEER